MRGVQGGRTAAPGQAWGGLKVTMPLDRRWLPLNALRAFEAVGRHLSFTAAANSLLVSQSAVSRHVIQLERLLGVQLFERRPHALALTDAGRALLPAVTKSYDRLEQVLNEIVSEQGRLRRVLRVQLPPSFAHHLAVPILREFRAARPEVVLDIETRPQPGPPARDADLAVVYAKPQVTDLVSDLLWPVRLAVVCHPAVAERGAGQDLPTFLASNELLHVKIEGQPRHHLWERLALQCGLQGLKVDRGLAFDTAVLAARYAGSGEGVAILDPVLFEEELRRGELVRPFRDLPWLEEGHGYYLLLHPDDLGDEAVALFRSWLIRRFAATDRRTRAIPFPESGATVVPLERPKDGRSEA
jgi:DNA-binding transcriptional LysR family regulator